MSHFTKVKTKITNMEMLKKALSALNIGYNEAANGQKITVKGWETKNIETDFSIDSGCSYGIAVHAKENELSFEADWWAIETYTGVNKETFLQKLEKQYAYETVMDKIKSKGYSIVEEEQSKEQIKIVVRRWV